MMQQVSTSGSSIWIGWKRRVSAGSFSIYCRYSAQVVAAMVRSVPRASAGFSRLAASPVPADAAGADQGVGLVDEQDDRRRRILHLVDDRTQPLLELALHRRACLHQPDVERAEPHALQRRRNVARRNSLREALDDGRLADARLAGEDRVVLPPPHQDVDELADFVVAAEDRDPFPRTSPSRSGPAKTDRAASYPWARGACCDPGVPAATKARAVHRAQVLLFRSSPDIPMLGRQDFDIDLVEFLRQFREGTTQIRAICSAATSTWPVRICVSPKNSVA